jgi:hypothetical protein
MWAMAMHEDRGLDEAIATFRSAIDDLTDDRLLAEAVLRALVVSPKLRRRFRAALEE